MVNGLPDTNILIDYLNAVPEARAEMERYEKASISIITWMEVMVGAPAELEGATRQFLERFDLVELDNPIAERAGALRRSHRIKLPDAVIWASAMSKGMLLVTRDVNDVQLNDPGVRLPYRW